MLVVMLIWAYVLATTYLLGYFFLNIMAEWPVMGTRKGKGPVKRYRNHFQESYIITGVVLATIYAEIWSLFSGVSLKAIVVLTALCVVIGVYYRYELVDEYLSFRMNMSAGLNGYMYLLIFVVMAYGTSHGIMHYDSDLYHAQAIHWIEQYGVVKGLGNLHVRLAYNSAAFPLSALYSMSFTGRSYHVMAGFFALLLAWQCLDIKIILERGHLILSDFARMVGIYYLFTIFDEMVAPASDYFLSTLVFYIIIHWTDMYVKHERSYVPYIQLALLGIYAITIKLSAAPMMILSIVPIYKLLHNRDSKKLKALGISVALAFAIVIPFLIRNTIISGWILYPVTTFDFFGFKWEIPRGVAQFDAAEIQSFGRGYKDVTLGATLGTFGWVKDWFDGLRMLDKAMLIADAVAIAIYLAIFIYFITAEVEKHASAKKGIATAKIFDISHRSAVNIADFLTLGGTLIGCLGFWFMSAPLIRYGIVYVLLTAAVVFGRIIIAVHNRVNEEIADVIHKAVVILLAVWVAFKAVMVGIEDYPRLNPYYLLSQQDYGTYEVDTYELGKVTFYYPKEGDRIGYYPFPSSPRNMTGEVELMGEEINSGFRHILGK